jgi:hypothetical protein
MPPAHVACELSALEIVSRWRAGCNGEIPAFQFGDMIGNVQRPSCLESKTLDSDGILKRDTDLPYARALRAIAIRGGWNANQPNFEGSLVRTIPMLYGTISWLFKHPQGV